MKTLLFFQRGNYASALESARAKVPETYRDQYASVAYVESLSSRYNVVVVSSGDDPHDIQIDANLRSVRLYRQKGDITGAAELLKEIGPDLIVVRSPYVPVLEFAKSRNIPCLPCFADIFHQRTGLKGLSDRLQFRRLRKTLVGENVACISNHSLNASRSMVSDLGLPAESIVPWDWSRVTPEPDAKQISAGPISAFYAGLISEGKGVGDCLEAVALLKSQGRKITLDLAGNGNAKMPLEGWKARAKSMGLETDVTFLGLVPNADVRALMAARDIVLIPSRQSYREGLPNTIYEGLACRSPLVISDHPAFKGRLVDQRDCVQFKNGDPASLAQAIQHLTDTPDLYASLSANAPKALEQLYVGLEWSDLIDLFLQDPSNKTGWVEKNTLTDLMRPS